MKFSRVALVTCRSRSLLCGAVGFQRTADFGFGNDDSPTNVKAEFYWSRLAYSSNMASLSAYRRLWTSRLVRSWSRDYPKADRQFLIAMHRLTRIDGRPTEQVVTLDYRRNLQLSVDLRGAGAELDFHRRRGQTAARVPAQGRLSDGR